MSSPHILTGIRSGVKYGLETITTDNDYNKTILAKNISDPPQNKTKFTSYPGINIDYGDVAYHNANGAHVQGGENKFILKGTVDFIFDCYMSSMNDQKNEQESILADIQKYFGNNYAIPDSEGNATCLSCICISAQPFAFGKEQKPNCGIQIIYRIWFRQSGVNPTLLA